MMTNPVRLESPAAGVVAAVLAVGALALATLPAGAVAQSVPAAAEPDQPTASGPIPIAVLPLGLSDETRRRYPQLSERNVGFGVHNMLVEDLYDTGRFRFVEDKPEVVEDLLNRQWVASTGAVDTDSAVRYGRLLGARYVVYGEVYDFATRRVKRRTAETRIGIQLRLVDVETTEYVPASATGTVVLKGEVFSLKDSVEFTRSTVGQATAASLEKAVPELLARFDRFRAAREGGR